MIPAGRFTRAVPRPRPSSNGTVLYRFWVWLVSTVLTRWKGDSSFKLTNAGTTTSSRRSGGMEWQSKVQSFCIATSRVHRACGLCECRQIHTTSTAFNNSTPTANNHVQAEQSRIESLDEIVRILLGTTEDNVTGFTARRWVRRDDPSANVLDCGCNGGAWIERMLEAYGGNLDVCRISDRIRCALLTSRWLRLLALTSSLDQEKKTRMAITATATETATMEGPLQIMRIGGARDGTSTLPSAKTVPKTRTIACHLKHSNS